MTMKLRVSTTLRFTKKHFMSVLLLCVLVASFGYINPQPAQAAAGIPKLINFQGKLTDATDGTNVPNGTYSMQFKLYDDPTAGSLLWTETWDGTGGSTQVTVTNGVFNVKLGSFTALSSTFFNTDAIYLTVNFNDGGGYDGEMSPRKRLTAAAYAFNANNLVGDGIINITNTSTNQATINYDGSNKLQIGVGSAGLTTFTATGGSAGFLFSGGNLGVGGSATAKLQSTATTEQLRLAYDGSNYVSFTTASGGDLTIAPTGSGSDIGITETLKGNGTSIFASSDSNSDKIAILPQSTTNTSTFTGTITTADLTGNQTYTFPNASGTVCLSGGSCTASAVRLDQIIAATATNSIDSDNFAQTWNWDGLTTETGLTLASSTATTGSVIAVSSTGTAALTGQKALSISQSGANASGSQTTYGLYSTNTRTGSGTNIAGYFNATGGTNNYSGIFENGSVGIGTTAPTSPLTVVNTTTSTSAYTGQLDSFIDNASGALGDFTGSSVSTNLSNNSAKSISNYNGFKVTSGVTGDSSTITDWRGIYSNPGPNTGALSYAVTNLTGVDVLLSSGTGATGTITNAYGLKVANTITTPTVTNGIGVLIQAQTIGTNNIGLNIDEATGTKNTNLLIGTTTQPAGSWSIYDASGDNSYLASNLGIGTATISAKLHVLSTTEQLRLGYDAANYTSFTTSSGGDLTIAPSGGDLAITGNVDLSGVLQAGSSNVNLTLATGFIDADAITLTTSGGAGSTFSSSGLEVVSDGLTLLKGCADNQVLKWDDSTDIRWECANDSTGGAGSLQSSYDGGNSIETTTNPVIITETGAGAFTHDLLQLTANPSSSTFGGDGLQITQDGGAADAFTGNGLHIVIDQSQNTGNAILIEDDAANANFTLDEDGALTLGTLAATTAITITDTSYTNALSIADNNITSTTANFTGSNWSITGSSGAAVFVGVNSGSGLIQGSGGLTISSGTTAITGTTNINTSGSATTTIGAGSGTNLVLQDADWGVTGAGAATFASVTAATINATSALQLGGTDINTAGTLTNVAYKNQANTFTFNQTVTPTQNSVNALTVNGTSGTAATALVVAQTGNAAGLTVTGSGSSTASDLVTFTNNVFAPAASSSNNLLNLIFTNASSNAAGSAFTTGLEITPTFNTTGAGTHVISGIHLTTPATTACAGTCTSTAIAIGGAATYNQILTFNGTSIINGSGQLVAGQIAGTIANSTVWNGSTIGVQYGGTGVASTTAYGVLLGGTTSTGAFQNAGAGNLGEVLVSNGASAVPTWQATPACSTCLVQVPSSTATNTIQPTASGVVALTVNGSSNATGAVALNVAQTKDFANLTMSNTAKTSGNLLSVSHSTSAFTGTAMLMNIANGSGSFASGNFIDLQSNGTSKFKVDYDGAMTLNKSISITTAGSGGIIYPAGDAGSGTIFSVTGGSNVRWGDSGNTVVFNTDIVVGNNGQIKLGSGSDAGVFRTGAAAVEINTGTAGVYGDLRLRSLQYGAAKSASAWGLNGIALQGTAVTYTDSSTAGAGTATNAAIDSVGQSTLAATNSTVTTTNAFGIYLAGAPISGTNQTLTNTSALYIAAAASVDGAGGTPTNSYGLNVNAQTGATNNYAAIFQGGNVGIGITAPTSLLHLVQTITDTGHVQDIDLTLGNDGGVDTIAGLNIDLTSAATADADVFSAIQIGNVTGNTTVVERGINFGTGLDTEIYFADSSAQIGIANGGSIIFEDGSSTTENGTDIFVLRDWDGSSANHVIYGDSDTGLQFSNMTTDILSTSGETLVISGTNAALTLQTTTSGNINLSSAGGTIELQDQTNVTGALTATGVLQVGSATTVAYSRLGTATTGHGGDIDASNDLLISGGLEVDGNTFIDGNITIAGTCTGCGSGGDSITVNASAATDANFIDVAASSTVAAITWTLNTVPTPDTISLAIGAANGTDAGILTAGTQTIGGAKTFTSDINLLKADAAITLTNSGSDTDFWLGITDDGGADDDDFFQIGDGSTPGTNPFFTVDTSGKIGIGTSVFGTNNKLLVNAYSAVDNLATAQISTSAATNKGLVIQGFASQSADLLQLQDNSGLAVLAVNYDGTNKVVQYTSNIADSATSVAFQFNAPNLANPTSYIAKWIGAGTTYSTLDRVGQWFMKSGGISLIVQGSGAGSDIQEWNTGSAGNTKVGYISNEGAHSITPIASTSGSPFLFNITGPAHTGLTASTEAIDVNLNLARTVQFATGALTTQRAAVVQAPTYGFVGASTLTNAATFAITGAPVAGTNATITNRIGLWAQGTAGANQYEIYAGPAVSSFSATLQSTYIGASADAFTVLNGGATRNTAFTGANQDDSTNDSWGGYGVVEATHTSGTKANAIGFEGDARATGAGGTVTLLSGVAGFSKTTNVANTVTTMASLTGFTNSKGASSTVSLNTGLYLQDQTGVAGTAANNYQIYSAGSVPFVVRADGNVGIGTAAPSSILHTIASGAKTASYTGNLLTNTATSSTASINKIGLNVSSTGTWNGTSAINYALKVDQATGGTYNHDIWSGPTNFSDLASLTNTSSYNSNNVFATDQLSATQGTASVLGWTRANIASTGSMAGVIGYITDDHATGTVTDINGLAGDVRINAAGNTTAATGGYFNISKAGAGTLGTAYGVYIDNGVTAGTTTSAYGLYVGPFTNSATLTNAWGIRVKGTTSAANNIGISIEENSGGTNQTNLAIGPTSVPIGTYSIYNASTDQNYFAGNLGIGATAAQALLEVAGADTVDGVIAISADRSDDSGDTWFLKSLASGNSFSLLNEATEVLNVSSTGALQIDGPLQVGAATALGYNRLSVAGTTGHALNDVEDLLIGDDLEVNGDTWLDGNLTVTGTCTGCGGGGTTLTSIGAATADDTNNDNTNYQIAWDWSTLTTETAFKLQATGTGLTSGSLFNVASATTGAVSTGIAKFSATGNYSGTGGLLNATATASTAGTLVNFTNNTSAYTGTGLNLSLTGVTTGVAQKIDVGSGVTSGAALQIVASGTSAISGGLLQITHTGNFTSTGGLMKLAANSTTTGTIASITGNALTTGTALSIVGGNTQMTTGSALQVGGPVDTTIYSIGSGGTSGALIDAKFTNDSNNTSGTSVVSGLSISPKMSSVGSGGVQETVGVYVQAAAGTTGAGTQNLYGIRIGNQGSVTSSETSYGLYVDAQSGAGTASYAAIFAGGNVGIGTITPGALLDVDRPDATSITTEKVSIQSSATAQTLTDGTTITNWRNNQFIAPTLNGVAGGGTETVTNAATLYIDAAPSGSNITITNPYALWVDAGVSRFDGQIYGTNGTTSAPTYSFGADTGGAGRGFTYDSGQGLMAMVSGTTVDAWFGNKFVYANTGFIISNGSNSTANISLVSPASNILQLNQSSATPSATTLQGNGGRGGTDSNVAGASLSVAGGIGTGTGIGGDLILKVAYPGSSGSSANSLSSLLTISGTNNQSTAGTANLISLTPTVNQSSAAGYNAVAVNVTETATGLGEKNILDLQVASASRATISNNGSITLQDASILQTPYGGFGRFENHIKRSEEFDDDTDWIKTNVNDPTLNTQVAPDGSTSAEIVSTSSSGGNYCNFSGTAAGSSTFTFSVWAKSASSTQNFSLRIDAGATSCATANNVTGTEQTFTATTTWKRFSVTQTFSSATGNVKARLFPATSAAANSVNVYAWGAQLEQQSTPGSYAMTTNGTLTNTNRGNNIESNLTAAAGFLYGGRTITTVTGTAVTDSSQIGQFIRVNDNSSGTNVHTVRGLEVQAYSGSNISGINTGIATFGKTFGLHAETTSEANGTLIPAAVFADLNNSSATTSGNAIQAFTDDATSTDLVYLNQTTSTFTGNGLLMNMANGSGSFTGNFVDMQKNGTSKFTIDDTGRTDIKVVDADNAVALYINTEESTASQNVFAIETDAQPTGDATADNVKFAVHANGTVALSLYASAATEAVCFVAPGGADVENSANSVEEDAELYDCSGTPAADFAELYPVSNDAEVGDIMITSDQMVNTYDTDENGLVDWTNVKGKISRLIKSNTGYHNAIVGVLGDNYSDFSSTGYNIKDQDNPKSIALVGRVPVKVSNENGAIHRGDYITSSKSVLGYGMKATAPGMVIGQALADFTTGNTVMVYVHPFYFDPTVSIDEAGNINLQHSNSSTTVTANTTTSAAYLIKQEGTGNILQLQNNDVTRLMVASSGSITINAEAAEDTDSLLVVKRDDAEQFSINARGDVTFSGALVMKNDTFAGSVVTDAQGQAEIRFSYDLGSGKPVIQLTVEGETPAFAQVGSWIKDVDGNYIGFIMRTYGIGGSPAQAVVHYNVTAKQEDYNTLGNNILTVTAAQGNNNEQVVTFGLPNSSQTQPAPAPSNNPAPSADGGSTTPPTDSGSTTTPDSGTTTTDSGSQTPPVDNGSSTTPDTGTTTPSQPAADSGTSTSSDGSNPS